MHTKKFEVAFPPKSVLNFPTSIHNYLVKMGRYCNFTTGVQYKFWFGVQSGADCEEFGGDWLRNWNTDPEEWDEMYLDGCENDDEQNEMTNKLNALKLWANGRDDFNRADIEGCPLDYIEEYVDWGHNWIDTDYEDVLQKCRKIQPARGLRVVPEDLDVYIRSFNEGHEGTYALQNAINDNLLDDDKELEQQWAKWMLGCLIAHQLLYESDLRCVYDV